MLKNLANISKLHSLQEIDARICLHNFISVLLNSHYLRIEKHFKLCTYFTADVKSNGPYK